MVGFCGGKIFKTREISVYHGYCSQIFLTEKAVRKRLQGGDLSENSRS
jgi:hypothetical protein